MTPSAESQSHFHKAHPYDSSKQDISTTKYAWLPHGILGFQHFGHVALGGLSSMPQATHGTHNQGLTSHFACPCEHNSVGQTAIKDLPIMPYRPHGTYNQGHNMPCHAHVPCPHHLTSTMLQSAPPANPPVLLCHAQPALPCRLKFSPKSERGNYY